MGRLRRLCAFAAVLASCGPPTSNDGVPNPSPSNLSPKTPLIRLVLGTAEAGSLVTLTQWSADEVPTETTTISDGSPMVLTGTPDEVFIATVADPAGNVLSINAMGAPCTMAASRQLRVPSEYPTIQSAVDAASPGDTVKVAPGTYEESVLLRRGVCLLGSGAKRTTLDAGGAPRTLVDLTGAPGSVVAGFTIRGVEQPTGCARPDDPFACSGNWYRAGVYLGGELWNDPVQDAPPIVANNVFTDNDIGVMLYWRGVAVIRNNVFVANSKAFVANHFQSRTLVANNVFYANAELAIGNQAAYLDIINNIIAESSVGIRFQYGQTGHIRCNVFFSNGRVQENVANNPPRFSIGDAGNVEADPKFLNANGGDFHLHPGSPAKDAGCFPGDAFEHDGTAEDIGAYGGPWAGWADL